MPPTLTAQSYPPELIEAGREQFGSQCAFCHGLDTAGASGGPDLTRSELVARDVRGDAIGPVVRSGRLDAEIPMPAFPGITDSDLDALVAFIHEQKTLAESAEGGRRSVSVEDLQTGDARAGQRYFEARCTACHSADGDLDGVGARLQGLELLQRMLYPRTRGARSAAATSTVAVTTRSGDRFNGAVAYEDEFTIALTDAGGRYRSFDKRDVDYEVTNPLQGHIDLLGQYTDEDMHDVLAFLQRLL